MPIQRPSILFDNADGDVVRYESAQPLCFADLNLDQVVATMIRGREEYDLAPFLYTPLQDVDGVRYRQEVMQELEIDAVHACVVGFARAMRAVREQVTQAAKLRHRYQRGGLLLDAVEAYGDAVKLLSEELAALDLRSRGLVAIREFVAAYNGSNAFMSLVDEAHALQESLHGVRYCVHVHQNRVQVTAYEGEQDYTEVVAETFAKFKRADAKDYRVTFSDRLEMNHVEAQILDRVALLNPALFARLDAYCARHSDFLDATIVAFDREVQLYLAYLEYTGRFKSAGMAFCYPAVSRDSKEISATEAFDLALAGRLVSENAVVVRNDFALADPERVLVVTGPNQGGKTTFARMVGQLHYLAALGYPVPATSAQLFLADRLVTHFEKEEDLATGRGKLEEELIRVHDALVVASGRSIFILNESFTSTTLADALFLGTEVLTQIIALDALCVCVTFVDELATLSPTTVSMVTTVDPDDPATRTFKLVRRPADGLAYAAAIAEKYGLGYASLMRRLGR